jgi:hypothetical protein
MSFSTKTKSEWFDFARLYESFEANFNCVTNMIEWIFQRVDKSSLYARRSIRRFIVKKSHRCCENFLLIMSSTLYFLCRRRNVLFFEFKNNDLCFFIMNDIDLDVNKKNDIRYFLTISKTCLINQIQNFELRRWVFDICYQWKKRIFDFEVICDFI